MGVPPNPINMWLQNNHDANGTNGAASFVNLNLTVVTGGTSNISDPGAVNFNSVGFDITDGGPAGFPLPPVDAGISP